MCSRVALCIALAPVLGSARDTTKVQGFRCHEFEIVGLLYDLPGLGLVIVGFLAQVDFVCCPRPSRLILLYADVGKSARRSLPEWMRQVSTAFEVKMTPADEYAVVLK